MDSEEYDMIREIQGEYRQAVADARALLAPTPDQSDGPTP